MLLCTLTILILTTSANCQNNPRYYYFNQSTNSTSTDDANGYLKESINCTQPSKWLFHGWLEDTNREYIKEMTQKYTANDNQVIQVDWGAVSRMEYTQAAAAITAAGVHVGNQLRVILDKCSDDFLEHVHFVGHSMGAHLAGYAARHVAKLSGARIARISALDPARPLFRDFLHAKGLQPAHARLVDVTHTNGEGFGVDLAIGHRDFYANGGRAQPGCERLDQDDVFEAVFCSHHRSYRYYIDSIEQPLYVALKCTTYSAFKNGACCANERLVYGEHLNATLVDNEDVFQTFFFDTK